MITSPKSKTSETAFSKTNSNFRNFLLWSSRYGGYGHDTLTKGARVIHLNEDTGTVKTYVVNEAGERGQILYLLRES